ncbi:MAG: hypothetical protein BMS9Abin05_2173 [Rhodothermia bacterium]|nr:MAG: hypothetical protein BMS9Abin05_2173 [Rhodothermia bacterium]
MLHDQSIKNRSKHLISTDDREFLSQFEARLFPENEFHHREHVRLAYILLTQHVAREAHARFRSGLKAFINYHGIEKSKYHETISRAWMLAVDLFMNQSDPSSSSEEFISQNPRLLKTEIMLTHYSRERLFSESARTAFVEPDLEPIP